MPATVRHLLSGPLPALVRACHPQPTLAVTALTTALAAVAGSPAPRCALVAATVLTGQLSIGWGNDVLDRRLDALAGRRDKPLTAGRVSVRTVASAALAALAVTTGLSFLAGARAGLAHLAVVAGGWAYDLGLKRTVLSWLPYAWAFALLPAYAVLARPDGPSPAGWLVAAGSLLGVGAHFFNVLPDLTADRAAGLRSLPVRLGPTGSRVAGCLLLVAAGATVVLGPPGPPGVGGMVALAVATTCALAAAAAPAAPSTTQATGRSAPTPFLLALLAAAVDLALLVLVLDPATAVA